MGPVSRPAPLSAPSLRGFGRGTSSVSARQHRMEWSGTARSSPSRPMTEPISPSVCRCASRNTALNVSAVRIARSEYSGCPPRLVRRSAFHASTAASENQTVKLPRRRRLSSYSRQFVTLRFCSGMWRRRSWFSLKGKAGIPGQTEGRPATSIGPRVLPVGSLQQRDVRRRPAWPSGESRLRPPEPLERAPTVRACPAARRRAGRHYERQPRYIRPLGEQPSSKFLSTRGGRRGLWVCPAVWLLGSIRIRGEITTSILLFVPSHGL